MAVDTKDKRMSAFNYCDPFDHILPDVDGTVDAADRQHLWGMYSGILADAPVVGIPSINWLSASGEDIGWLVMGGEAHWNAGGDDRLDWNAP